MAGSLTRQLLRRLPVLIPRISRGCSFQGVNRPPISSDEVEEYRRRQLWLKFRDRDVTKEDIMTLSADIQAVNIRIRDKGCFVYVDFESEEVAETNYSEMQKAGLWVSYCGVKRRMFQPVRDTSRPQRTPFNDPYADKKLRLRFNTIITEEEIKALSDDIVKLKVMANNDSYSGQTNTKVIVEFGTAEQALQHYDKFQMISIRENPAKVYKCESPHTSETFSKEPSKELLLKELGHEETEESLLAEFPTANTAFIFFSLRNQRWARLKFADPESCLEAFKEHCQRRMVSMYHSMDGKPIKEKPLNKLELRMKLKPWHTKTNLKETFPKATNLRFFHRLHQSTGALSQYAFISFDNEDDCHAAYTQNNQLDIQYCFIPEYDYKTLVLNAISDWDDTESLQQLFPDVTQIYIHKTVSQSGERTLRNAFLLFDCEEKCKAALEEHSKRRLHYRVKR